jgi:hypothetical protein
MSFHNICSKTDRALVAYLTAYGVPGGIWPAKRSLDKALPITVCYSHSATPLQDAPFSGIYTVTAFVEVRSDGVVEETQGTDDPRLNSDDLFAAVADAFWLGDDSASNKLAEAITNAARASGQEDLGQFTIQSVLVSGHSQGFNPRSTQQQGNAWVDSVHLEMVCCPSDVS